MATSDLKPRNKVSRSNPDLVVPHQLCEYCARIVDKSECLKLNDEDLLPKNYKFRWEDQHVQHIIDAYPSISTIFQSADKGCHLCTIFVSHISDTHTPDQVRGMRQRAASDGQGIFAVVRLRPAGPTDLDTTFWILLHWNKPQKTKDGVDAGSKFTGVTAARVNSTRVQSCQICDFCLTIPRYHEVTVEKVNVAQQQAHYRWVNYTGSDTSMQMVQGWLDRCLADHSECNAHARSKPPTRLLHLAGSGVDGDVRLVSGTKANDLPYATLSYCWGSQKAFVLTRSNLDSWYQRIHFHSMPKTFQDAIIVCRKLGVAYLWIDALCIIQGADGDWEVEAPRMGEVYGGSTFTIAAAQGQSSYDGFLRHRSPLRLYDCKILHDDTHTVLVRGTDFCIGPGYDPGKCRLDTRGWVCQERALSPRTLYFGPDGIHWECRKGVLCELQPFTEIYYGEVTEEGYYLGEVTTASHIDFETQVKDVYKAIQNIDSICNLSDANKFRQSWSRLLEIYSQTSLTYDSDKLVAMSGIPSAFQGRLKLQASFGLWLPLFASELLWATSETRDDAHEGKNRLRLHRRNFLAPSWSWASLLSAKIRNEFVQTTNLYREEEEKGTHAEMVVFQKLPAPTAFDPFGTLPAGDSPQFSVKLSGMLRKCIVSKSPIEPGDKGFFRQIYPETRWRNPGYSSADLVLDMPLTAEIPLYCLLVIQFELGSPKNLMQLGLVLTPVDISKSQYRRIGLFRQKSDCGEGETDTVGFTPRQRLFESHGPRSIVEII